MSVKTDQMIKDLKSAIQTQKGTSPYDTTARVVRVDGDTLWVHIDGGAEETPVQKTVNANVGDDVHVRVSNGSAWVTGNYTAPPTDDAKAVEVERVLGETTKDVEEYKEATNGRIEANETAIKGAKAQAEDAFKIAGNTNQYFWHIEEGTDTGAHITEIPQEQFLENPEAGGGNLLARSNGIAVRDGLTELSSFGANGTQIGKTDETHIEMDYHSFEMVDKEGHSYVYLSDLRDEDGDFTVNDSWIGDGLTGRFPLSLRAKSSYYQVTVDGQTVTDGIEKTQVYFAFDYIPSEGSVISASYVTNSYYAKAYTLGVRESESSVGASSYGEGINITASGNFSHAEGKETTASGMTSHAEGSNSTASGITSHAEGDHSTASGNYSHAEGDYTTASGYASHAEGDYSTSSGSKSHAEGNHSTASGNNSHAEGTRSVSSGSASHAEGSYTTASGNLSHTEGSWTIASSDFQHVQGKYNVEDTQGLYADIVGWGTSDANRKNISALTTGGELRLKGDVYVGCADDSTGGTKVVPETRTVNGKALSSNIEITGEDLGIGAYYTEPSTPKTTAIPAGSSFNKLTMNDSSTGFLSLSAGRWLLIGNVEFPADTTGRCGVAWMIADSSSWIQRSAFTENRISGITRIQSVAFVTPTATTEYCLGAFNSHVGQTVTARFIAIRLR